MQIQDCSRESHHSREPSESSQTGATAPPKASCQKHPESKQLPKCLLFLLYKPRSYFKHCWSKGGLYHNQMSIPAKLESRGWNRRLVSTYFSSDIANSLRRGQRRSWREQQGHRRKVEDVRSLSNSRQQNIISLTNKSC